MASFSDIANGFVNASQTLGYDAIISIAEQQLNTFLFDQYAANGPGTPVTAISAVVATEDSLTFWILDLALGPPLLSFPSTGTEVQLEMTLTGGTITQVDFLHNEVDWVLHLVGGLSTLTGTFNLGAAKGSESTTGTDSQVGQIILNLGDSLSWEPTIEGLPQGSISLEQIGAALQAIYRQQPYIYQIGTIMQPASLDAGLLPTSFTFVGVAGSDGSPGCINIQIVTNGPGSQDSYGSSLVPDDSTVGILLSARVVQEVLLNGWPALFPDEAPNVAPTFAASTPASGSWSLMSSGGVQDVAAYSQDQFTTVSGDGGDPSDIMVPWGNLVFTAGLDAQVTYAPSWTQWWRYVDLVAEGRGGADVQKRTEYGVAGMAGNYTSNLDFTISPGTANVSIGATWGGSIKASSVATWLEADVSNEVNAFVGSAVSDNLVKSLSNLPIPQVNEFYLQSVLFPAGGLINLTQALLPYDLYTAGTVSSALSVQPSDVTVAPGETVQFNVAGNGTTWRILAPCGSITSAGSYTAPAKPNRSMVVVEASQVVGGKAVSGFAIVRIAPAVSSHLTISPSSQTLPSSAQTTVTLNDQKATLSVEAGQGSVQKVLGGIWSFNAPKVTEPTLVTFTASDGSQQTQVQWMILPVDPSLAVVVSETQIAADAGLQVTAKADNVSTVAWSLYASDENGPNPLTGTLEVTGMAATYTAPALSASAPPLSVMIIAYSTDQCLAVAQTSITVTAH